MKRFFAIAAALAAFPALAPVSHAQQLQIGINPINFGVYVWRQTNAYRAAQGATKIPFTGRPIWKAAQQYAEYLARTNSSGHTADGRLPIISSAIPGE